MSKCEKTYNNMWRLRAERCVSAMLKLLTMVATEERKDIRSDTALPIHCPCPPDISGKLTGSLS